MLRTEVRFPAEQVSIALDQDLELRQLMPEDALECAEVVASCPDHLGNFGNGTPVVFSDAQRSKEVIGWQEKGDIMLLGIRNRGELAGCISLNSMGGQVVENGIEIGWWVAKQYTRRGFATAAARAATKFAFEQDGVNAVAAFIAAGNVPSALTAQNIGLKYMASLQKYGETEWGFCAYDPLPIELEGTFAPRVIEMQELGRSADRSAAFIELDGVSPQVTNNVSDASYTINSGRASFVTGEGEVHNLEAGDDIFIPAGIPCRGIGRAGLVATFEPPFTSESIQIL